MKSFLISLIIFLLVAASCSSESNSYLMATAYLNEGTDYYRKNSYAVAEEMFKRALEQDSSMVEAYQNLGVLYYAQGNPRKAIEQWHRAIELDSTYPDRARLYLFIGVAYLFAPDIVDTQSNFVEEAFVYIDCALDLDPGLVEAHYWRARAWELAPNIDSAIAGYQRTTKLDCKYAPAYNSWGILLYIHSENGRGSIEKFNRAVFLEPENATYHYNLGAAYLKAGHLGDGLAAIARARRLNPNIQTRQDMANRTIVVGQ